MAFSTIFIAVAFYIMPVCMSLPLRNETVPEKTNEEIMKELDVVLPDHLAGLKMERDGHINKDFHKEVFLGREAEKFENEEFDEDKKQQLLEIFLRADANGDKGLDEEELTMWILEKTREHFEEAAEHNAEKFAEVDLNRDGLVSWFEMVSRFMEERGYDRREVLERLEKGKKIHVNDDYDLMIEELHDKWLQADPQAPGDVLTEEKFMDFQHPETSQGMIKLLVDDFMHDMDMDGSRDLTVQEYVAVAPDVNIDNVSDDDWTTQRRDEFRNVIDQDGNGIVDEAELESYLDPLSDTMAGVEARQMIDYGDEDGDGALSWDEIVRNSEFFTGSKLFNYAKNVHEEF